MDELHERMLEDLYTLIGYENAGREELCFFLRSAEEKALRFTRQRVSAGRVLGQQRPRNACQAFPTTVRP